jgi:hypothetical protein
MFLPLRLKSFWPRRAPVFSPTRFFLTNSTLGSGFTSRRQIGGTVDAPKKQTLDSGWPAYYNFRKSVMDFDDELFSDSWPSADGDRGIVPAPTNRILRIVVSAPEDAETSARLIRLRVELRHVPAFFPFSFFCSKTSGDPPSSDFRPVKPSREKS